LNFSIKVRVAFAHSTLLQHFHPVNPKFSKLPITYQDQMSLITSPSFSRAKYHSKPTKILKHCQLFVKYCIGHGSEEGLPTVSLFFMPQPRQET